MDRDQYIEAIADILNRESEPRERERLLREANRNLYRAAVDSMATTVQADLALAQAGVNERDRRIK